MNNELLIKNIDYSLLFSMLFVSILSAVFIYNIFQLIYKCLRRKKLKNTIKLILEGHEKLSVGKEDIIIEGEVLDNNMIAKQIQKNKDMLMQRQKLYLKKWRNHLMLSPPQSDSKKKKRCPGLLGEWTKWVGSFFRKKSGTCLEFRKELRWIYTCPTDE